jgi:glutamyl-tRNA synthetase
MVNYLARLGWSHGDQEIFAAEELIEHFSLEKVGFTAAVFDTAKLEWLNGYWLRQTPPGKLAQRLLPFLERDGLISDPNLVDLAWLERVVASLQERSKTLLEMARSARFYFVDEVAYDDNARAKFLTPAHAGRLSELIGEVKRIEPFAADALEARYRELAAQWNLKLEELAQLTRVALTGGMVSPPIFTVMAILGRDRVLARLARALARIREKR